MNFWKGLSILYWKVKSDIETQKAYQTDRSIEAEDKSRTIGFWSRNNEYPSTDENMSRRPTAAKINIRISDLLPVKMHITCTPQGSYVGHINFCIFFVSMNKILNLNLHFQHFGKFKEISTSRKYLFDLHKQNLPIVAASWAFS